MSGYSYSEIQNMQQKAMARVREMKRTSDEVTKVAQKELDYQNKKIGCQDTLGLIRNSQKEIVAVSGLENIILVETEDAIMACKLDESQNVKNLNTAYNEFINYNETRRNTVKKYPDT